MTNDIGTLLLNAARETGVDLRRSAADVTVYVAGRTAHLATIAGQPGFHEALIAEADSVAIYAGINAVSTADDADKRLLGIIEGALMVGVSALA